MRELENVVERAATLARGPLITLADLGIEFTGVTSLELGLRPTLAELEDRYIRRVLEETKGDKTAAARILGVSVRTLQRRKLSRRGLGRLDDLGVTAVEARAVEVVVGQQPEIDLVALARIEERERRTAYAVMAQVWARTQLMRSCRTRRSISSSAPTWAQMSPIVWSGVRTLARQA